MRFLDDHGISYEEKNVVEEPKYMEELLDLTSGFRGTPVIVVGEEVLRGFDRGKVSRLLGL